MVVSREAKKKQHACASSGLRGHYIELFTHMAALNNNNDNLDFHKSKTEHIKCNYYSIRNNL